MKQWLEGVFGVLQKIGKALMLPVALLPAAGLLLGLGSMISNSDILSTMGVFKSKVCIDIINIMMASGEIIFNNLALLFAIGVAIGLSDGDGVAGLAATVGFLIMNITITIRLDISAEMISGNSMYSSVLGIPTIQTGVFGGIIIGILASLMYKKFGNIEFVDYLAFFEGKRFVPIITAVFSIVIGIIMATIWPIVQNVLFEFSRGMIHTNQTISAFIFGVVERALVPFGLHHIWYNPFWYQFGEYINSAGQLIIGDQNIFMAQLKDGVDFTAGTFMTGKFPFMMFGLPAAALAMYHEAKDCNKRFISGLLLSAALTSFITGITEPIEFMFIFVAPMLFVVHCIFAGMSFLIMDVLNIKIGLTFSGGVIDFILFGVIPGKTDWWKAILVGIAFAVIYYLVFRIIIRKFDLKTPGRDENEKTIDINVKDGQLATQTLMALGGARNIEYLDACITRLRVSVNDKTKVRRDLLKSLGAADIMAIGENIQAIFGPKSGILKDQIKDIIEGREIKSAEKKIESSMQEGEDTGIIINSPLSGALVELEEVPDDIFSMKLMGDGFAIEPNNNLLYSPVKGKIISILPNKHCLTIKSNNGFDILIHIGIDTIKWKDEDFKAFVKVGDDVEYGQKLIEFPIEIMKKKFKSSLVIIIFRNLNQDQYVYFKPNNDVKCCEQNVVKIYKKNKS